MCELKSKTLRGRVKIILEESKQYFNKIRKLRYEDFVRYLYEPTNPSSLGVIRFLFGMLMAIDIFEERGGSEIDVRWGNPETCHFPLFTILKPPAYPFMCLLYGVMWIGSIGVMVGFKFRLSIFLFGIPYWYIFLLDKSFWNNHSYLYGIVTILLMGSSANHYFSFDSLLNKKNRNKPVPYWNYFILKYQFFLLYFLAGLKKSDREWLEGYSMNNLGGHWVFWPFRIILSTEHIDYLIVHWFGFILDLTIGFWMLMEFSRPVAIIFCAMFHLMNSRLFSIGMFPYVCLATLPLFCKEDWPQRLSKHITSPIFTSFAKNKINREVVDENRKYLHDQEIHLKTKVKFKHKLVVALLVTHMGLQVFLPFSHFITKGYNNWTNGLYGYSWDMMVHSWDTVLVVVKIVDNYSGKEHFINSKAWTLNERWNKHADMCLQYAECVRSNLEKKLQDSTKNEMSLNHPLDKPILSENLSIYIDVWCSLNKRFQQRMYDPNYDLMRANWSPFRPVEWLMPVLSEYNEFRRKITEISGRVHSFSNESEVLFVADFPGMSLENYIGEDIHNISITVLEGDVVYEIEDSNTKQSVGINLNPGDSFPVAEGFYHKIHTISPTPSCYMYTFIEDEPAVDENATPKMKMYSPLPLIEDISSRTETFIRMIGLILNATSNILFQTPIVVQTREVIE